MMGRSLLRVTFGLLLLVADTSCSQPTQTNSDSMAAARLRSSALIPLPVTMKDGKDGFGLRGSTRILAANDLPGERAAVSLMQGYLGMNDTSYTDDNGVAGRRKAIRFSLSASDDWIVSGSESYRIVVSTQSVNVAATSPAGLLWAVQTLRQLLPAKAQALLKSGESVYLPSLTIEDSPRYAWRGVMIDVARRFYPPEAMLRWIDLAALYKLNRFHIHLTDDQGWRLQIPGLPRLTGIGATTAVDGAPAGFYTVTDYGHMVSYAAVRGITIIPEIDMPGHSQAALASYAQLNCDGIAPPVYEGRRVGFSTLCPDKPDTWTFVRKVLTEVARMTPGSWIHLGGDESKVTAPDAYRAFVTRAAAIVRELGKEPIFWEEAASAGDPATFQLWIGNLEPEELPAGSRMILSPSQYTYMDMMNEPGMDIGTVWMGFINAEKAYSWDPEVEFAMWPANIVRGIEAPLWTETVPDASAAETLMLPRLPGYAEIGWSQRTARYWPDYRKRLLLQTTRWEAMGLVYYREEGWGE